jgi:hypothetical protein
MPLRSDPALSDLYRVFADIAPDLRARVADFQAPAGQICDQMQLAVKDKATVLTLGIYKIRPDTPMVVRTSPAPSNRKSASRRRAALSCHLRKRARLRDLHGRPRRLPGGMEPFARWARRLRAANNCFGSVSACGRGPLLCEVEDKMLQVGANEFRTLQRAFKPEQQERGIAGTG